ncbi:hypothetical protein [Methyloglobulus sp.]|uniref:hypothetical protein n=1 Tax=Methyloglobulus sp. TaxID=2518622 RepID=UPI0032B70382
MCPPPPCTKFSNLYLPSAFEIALINGEDPDYTDFAQNFQNTHPKIGWFNDYAVMQEYPDLELSLQVWRFRHNVYDNVCQKQQDAAKLQPLSGIVAPTAMARSVTTRPQHSLAENIFRKRAITLQVFDAGGGYPFNNDGDAVDIWFNGERIRTNAPILAWPGISLPLTLQPSDLLAAKTNQLYFKVVNTGFWFDPGATIGVNIAPANASKIFQHASVSNLRVHPQAVKWHLGLNQTTPVLNLALGLMCYDHKRWPESTLHVQRA